MAAIIIRNRGYDCNQSGPWMEYEDMAPLEVVADLLEVERVSFTQPISDTPGCSTHVAYAPAATGGYTKVGVVQIL